MTTDALNVLLVEDDPDLRATLHDLLQDSGHTVEALDNGQVAAERAAASFFDVVLSDVQLPGMGGRQLLAHVRQTSPDTSVILITGYGDVAQAVAALREGASDYLTKPFDVDELLSRLKRVAERQTLRLELARAKQALATGLPETSFIGDSPPVRKLLHHIHKVAPSGSPCLIVGESGTGKELVARIIHEQSPRRDRPYVTINCGALAEHLVEAELFGHERGAFTGADKKREGRFKAADGGTLFLDEIGELPMAAQAKLLRVLQEGTFEPLGSNATVKVDVRVVSATHRDLRKMVRERLFREDLYYRINVVEVPIPPLRDRMSDLPLLVQHFLLRQSPNRPPNTLSLETWNVLKGHSFPGNVRELGHAISHAVIMAQGAEIRPEHLPAAMSFIRPAALAAQDEQIVPLMESMKKHERECIQRAINASGGVPSKAAALLKISPSSLQTKLKAHGLVIS
ncbi:MAG: sigma-54 dependent transcriptional regulator [Deltaproteobacteria bacterium]|nr:sigma-54 dependent transcriptional regulator [Deltaproteobacteria bacterium]